MTTATLHDLEQRSQRQRAFAAFARCDFRTAFRVGDGLLPGRPNDMVLRELVGICACKIGRVADAERHLRRALKRKPRESALHLALAETHVQRGRLDEALARYDRVLRDQPGLLPAVAGKALVLHRRGRSAEARSLLAPIIDAHEEDAYTAAAFATVEQSAGRFTEAVELLLRRHIASPTTDVAARRMLWDLLARARGAAGDHDGAFEAYSMKNELDLRPFDADAFVGEIDALIDAFSPENIATLPRAGNADETPIFIASMPRAGSTLVEQIIHAHPDAHGAGEITSLHELVGDLPTQLDSLQPYPACIGDLMQSHVDDLGRSYCWELGPHERDAKRIVNKHLQNWRYLGLVALLLPGARVVHCRRDPMDNCFSLFMADMSTERSPWASNLADIGLVYRQYERLMDHWRSVLDLEILDVPYEELVAEPEEWIRRIVGFCGLPWDDRCLRFHEAKRDVMTLSYDQVNRPVYRTAAGRYRKYLAHLGPLERALAR